MDYLLFTIWFTLLHIVSYTLAGMLAYRISHDLYHGEQRLLDFLKDMADTSQNTSVQKLFLPAQLLRGVLMSLVLYPLLGLLGQVPFAGRFAFFFGLLFIYTDFASAVPFPNNIEGFVYYQERYKRKDSFWKLYIETGIYSILLAGSVSWFLF